MIDVQTYRLDMRKLYGDPELPRANLMINAVVSCRLHHEIITTMTRYLDEASGMPFIDGYSMEVDVVNPSYLHADMQIRLIATGNFVPVLEQVATYISENRHRHYDD